MSSAGVLCLTGSVPRGIPRRRKVVHRRRPARRGRPHVAVDRHSSKHWPRATESSTQRPARRPRPIRRSTHRPSLRERRPRWKHRRDDDGGAPCRRGNAATAPTHGDARTTHRSCSHARHRRWAAGGCAKVLAPWHARRRSLAPTRSRSASRRAASPGRRWSMMNAVSAPWKSGSIAPVSDLREFDAAGCLLQFLRAHLHEADRALGGSANAPRIALTHILRATPATSRSLAAPIQGELKCA